MLALVLSWQMQIVIGICDFPVLTLLCIPFLSGYILVVITLKLREFYMETNVSRLEGFS